MYYFNILEALFREKIRYLIVGGLAVNLHGIPRVTYDIDIIISMDKENILKLNKILNQLDYIPRLSMNPDELADKEILKTWIEEKNLKSFSFYNKDENHKVIDISVVHSIDFEKAFKQKVVKKLGSIDINLINIKDLIKMKQEIGRKQDLSDIELLK